MSDIYVNIALICIIIFHFVTIIIGYKIKKTTLLISYLNVIVVIGLFLFWVITSPNILQHNLEFREVFVIGIEACILIFGLYSMIGFHNKTYVKFINFIGFGIHLLITAGLLYFMLTFKLNGSY